MNIAIVNQPLDGILPPDQSSIGIWTYEVARRISTDHEVTVYGRSSRSLTERGVPSTAYIDGVRYRFGFAGPDRIWRSIGKLWTRLFRPARPLYASIIYYLEYSLVVAMKVHFQRPDVVHIHNFTGFVPVVRLLNRRARIVLHMNCEWLSQLDERKMRRRIGQVDVVLGSSDHITDLVRRRFPELAARCHTVYNGVDPDAFVADDGASAVPIDDPAEIVFVGRVSPEKGVHDLVEAMATVAAERPTAKLDVIGAVAALDERFIVAVSDDPLVAGLRRFYPDDYGETLRQRAAGLEPPSVRFLGAMPQGDVARRVRAAQVLVNPSYSESFGMSLVEAMACEVPVIATRIGGMKEIVNDERTGLLVPCADPPALAAAILRLLEDPQLRRSMGANGRLRVESMFSWDKVAEAALSRYLMLPEKTTTERTPGGRSAVRRQRHGVMAFSRATSAMRQLRRQIHGVLRSRRVATIRTGPTAGLRIRLRGASNDYSGGDVERPVQDAIVDSLGPGDVFYDIGANVGFFTLLGASIVGPRGRVYAFEPRAEIVSALRANIELNGLDDRVRVWPVAVGASDGTVPLLCPDHPGGATIERSEATGVTRTEVVPCVTIDRLVRTGAIQSPSLVKIDVEGAEPAVLAGMVQTLRTARPIIVYEVDDANSVGVADKHALIHSLLESYGYRTEALPASYREITWHVMHAIARPMA